MRRARNFTNPVGAAVTAGVIAATLIASLTLWGRLEWLEFTALDLLFGLRGSRTPSAPIVIVAIDQETYDQLHQPWPLPRAMHARLIEVLSIHGPRVIGIDIIFSGPSGRGAEDDKALVEAVGRNRNVILATTIRSRTGEAGVHQLPRKLEDAAAGVGFAAMVRDSDGVVRSALIEERSGEVTQLSFGAEIAKRAGQAASKEATKFVIINFAGRSATYPRIPYHRIIEGKFSSDMIRDKIVLVGSSDPLEHDYFATPFGRREQMPGVEIHANLIATLLKGNAIREIPLEISAIFSMAAVALTIVLGRYSFRYLMIGTILLLAVSWVSAVMVFIWGDIWFRIVSVILGVSVGFVVALILIARVPSVNRHRE